MILKSKKEYYEKLKEEDFDLYCLMHGKDPEIVKMQQQDYERKNERFS